MTKRQILVELLLRYREAEAGAAPIGTQETHATGDQVALMPRCWNKTYRQLEQTLQTMSDTYPKRTRHLLARYVDATISRRTLKPARVSRKTKTPEWKQGQGRYDLGYQSEVIVAVRKPDGPIAGLYDAKLRSWPKWVRNQLVDDALTLLEKRFKGDPQLPSEFIGEEKAA